MSDEGVIDGLKTQARKLIKETNDWSAKAQEAGLEATVEAEGKPGQHRLILHLDKTERLL